MLYGRSIKFYKPLNLHYYGSKEKGEEDRQEVSKEEEEGIVPILPQTKEPTRGFFCFSILKFESREALSWGRIHLRPFWSDSVKFGNHVRSTWVRG